MTELRATLTGGRELDRQLGQCSDAVASGSLVGAATAGALLVRNRAVERLSIQSWKSGDLGRSVGVQTVESDRHHAVVAVGTDKEYGPYIEFGTGIYGEGPGAKRQPIVIRPKQKKALFWPGAGHPVRQVIQLGLHPRPFLRPAFDEMRDAALREMAEALADSLRSAVR